MNGNNEQNADHLDEFFDQPEDGLSDNDAANPDAAINANIQPQAAQDAPVPITAAQMAAFMHQMQAMFKPAVAAAPAHPAADPAAHRVRFAHPDRDLADDEDEVDDEVTFRRPAGSLATQPKPFKVSGRPPPFCITKDRQDFLIWRTDWGCFLFSSGIDQIADKETRDQYAFSHLRSALSTTTKRWLDSLEIDDSLRQDADFLVETIESQVFKTSNPTQSLVEILQHQQRNDETVDELRIYINQKAQYCFTGIHDWQDHVLRAAFIKALNCSETRKKLLAKKKLTYHECVEFARNEESAAREAKFLSGPTHPEANYTNKTAHRGQHKSHRRHNHWSNRQEEAQHNSYDRGHLPSSDATFGKRHNKSQNGISFHKACQTKHKFGLEHCPKKNMHCLHCYKSGHTADTCHQSNANTRPTINSALLTVGHVELPTVHEAHLEDNPSETLDLIDVTFQTKNGLSTTAKSLPDTGSNVCLLPIHVAKQIGYRKRTRYTGPTLADGSKLRIMGSTFADILYDDIHVKNVKFLISAHVAKPLLSRTVLKKLCLIPEDFPFAKVSSINADQPPTAQDTSAPPRATPMQFSHTSAGLTVDDRPKLIYRKTPLWVLTEENRIASCKQLCRWMYKPIKHDSVDHSGSHLTTDDPIAGNNARTIQL